jgi:hypothetical protein
VAAELSKNVRRLGMLSDHEWGGEEKQMILL